MDHISRATIATPKASSYLQQLCKHLGHKLETQVSPDAGSIAFGFGSAELRAQDGALHMTAEAGNDADLDRLRTVLTSHLERFAFREVLSVDWKD
ncbi:DUF2218 domain-containing protein [Gymnodinialimonas sp.]